MAQQAAGSPGIRAEGHWEAMAHGFGARRLTVIALVAAGLLWQSPALFQMLPAGDRLPVAQAGSAREARYSTSLFNDLKAPLAVAVGPAGDVYVADTGNGMIKVFAKDGMPKRTVGTKAAEAAGPGELVYPTGLALDQQGRLYVADTAAGRVSVFTATGEFAGYFGENAEGERPFGTPGSLFFRGGLLYISDLTRHRVVAMGLDGATAVVFGSGKGSAPGQMIYPGEVWADDHGTVFVADANNNRVQVFGQDGVLLGVITHPALNLPRGIVGDAQGQLYIASTLGHEVSVFSSLGQQLYSYGSSGSDWNQLGFPNGVAIDGDRLYVADRGNDRVQVLLLPLAPR